MESDFQVVGLPQAVSQFPGRQTLCIVTIWKGMGVIRPLGLGVLLMSAQAA